MVVCDYVILHKNNKESNIFYLCTNSRAYLMRKNGRQNNETRKINIIKNFISHPEGSVLIEFGETKVVCNATIETKVPNFLKGQNSGWVTAEYGMLPRSTNERMYREAKNRQSGRTMEIQRLVGRSLRSALNLDKLGEITITVDCDVIQADGGTRTASITGGFVALCLSIINSPSLGIDFQDVLKSSVASISVGKYEGDVILDLDYYEDSNADADMNFVMNDNNEFVEIQGTAEKDFFTEKEFIKMLDLAKNGISEIIKIQKEIIYNDR